MGIKKGIGWSIAGILAFQYAAYKLNQPGLGQLVSDMVHSGGIGEGIDTIFRYMFDFYGRDMFYDKFAALGTAGQAAMYGGLSNIVYNLFKKQEKQEPEKPEPEK
ncbi:MAG: hypothetical protein Q8N77_04955 [Nanoarchaeota archaeon]|nr:hypothetical protein [Nanoarchaeota archaeon]